MRYKSNKTAIIIDHVENYKRHGLPTTVHEWSLESKKRKKESSIKITVCDYCLAVNEFNATVCVVCGEELKIVSLIKTELEIVEHDIELIEVKDYSNTPNNYKDCKTILELYMFAMQRQYKGGWALIKADEMKLKYTCKEEAKAVRKLLGFKRGWENHQEIKEV